MVGECSDIRLLDARSAWRLPGANPELVVHQGPDRAQHQRRLGMYPLEIAVEVAEELGLPVMAHIDFPPPSAATCSTGCVRATC